MGVREIDPAVKSGHNEVIPELEPLYRQIGEILRRLRRERDLSQEALATAVHMSRSALANIEAGQQRVAVHQLLDLARALQVEPVSLLPSESEARSQPLDQELVEKGVPEAAARAVAKIMGEYGGDEDGVGTGEGGTSGAEGPRCLGHHEPSGPG